MWWVWVAVALVAWYWDVKVCNDRVAITGDMSLAGSLGGVLGLREKALAACYKLAGTFREPNGREVTTLASLLIPMDNCIKGVVVEPLSAIDGKANRKVRHWRDRHSDLGQDSSQGRPPRPTVLRFPSLGGVCGRRSSVADWRYAVRCMHVYDMCVCIFVYVCLCVGRCLCQAT